MARDTITFVGGPLDGGSYPYTGRDEAIEVSFRMVGRDGVRRAVYVRSDDRPDLYLYRPAPDLRVVSPEDD